jgi:hypothetical protein
MSTAQGSNLMDMLQVQLLGMGAMNSGGNDKNMSSAIYAIIVIGLFNQLSRALPKVLDYMYKFWSKYLEQKRNEFNMKMEYGLQKLNVNQIKKGSIIFDKTIGTSKEDLIFNSVIHYISEQKTSEKIIYNSNYFVINQSEFIIRPDIYCKVLEFSKDDKGLIDKYRFEVYSYVYNVSKLREFISEITDMYINNQSNKLGNKIYYFNEFEIKIPKEMDGSYRLEQSDKHLNFTMTPFKTNKNLNNIFGDHLDVLKKRVNMFINNPKWYESKGIPYTLGIMLHGPPGTGKTSTIKAIANVTNRHIFNISLKDITTKSQLNNLFYGERVKILNNGISEFLNIPHDKRIYVFEDIDCANDIVIDRKLKNDIKSKIETNITQPITNKLTPEAINKKLEVMFGPNDTISGMDYNNDMLGLSDYNALDSSMDLNNGNVRNPRNIMPHNPYSLNPDVNKQQQQEQDHPEKLNLSYFLNLLDGILETPGRIMVITSNYPEKLDKALIRPGRIDVNINVGYCNKDMINNMFNYFYDTTIDFKDIKEDAINKAQITPAEISKILQNNFDNEQNGYLELKNIINKK